MTKRLLLVGGGGHCAGIIDSIEKAGLYEIAGIVDRAEKIGDTVCGYPIVGCDSDLRRLRDSGLDCAFVSLGSVGAPAARILLCERLRGLSFALPSVVDPSAILATSALLSDGCYVGKNSVINSGGLIGTLAIINTGAIVEHGCRVGDFAHIAPGGVLSADVRVGDRTHIGANATVIQGLTIGRDCIIGAGSVVTRDIPDGAVAYGSPCRPVRRQNLG